MLQELARAGRQSLLLDFATDPAQRCPRPEDDRVRLLSPPESLLAFNGGVYGLRLPDDGRVVEIQHHEVHLARLVRLAAAITTSSAGCTQPSWKAVVGTEWWLNEVLTAVEPHTVLVSNDTSPLGVLSVHCAQRRRINTVHVQHGAWTAESVSWAALHSRDIVVMGERDVPLAQAWARHPRAQVHVLGQPRFDALAELDRDSHRRFLEAMLVHSAGPTPAGIAVWACQPLVPHRLQAQAELLLDGLQRADGDWGLVVAPHPAQSRDALQSLFHRPGGPPTAVADHAVGARGCLAGADVLASAYSTCGIEAVLLNIPVLELGLPGEHTLGLAEQGLAQKCGSADDIAHALNELSQGRSRITRKNVDAVCRWRGTSAADIARLIIPRADQQQSESGSSAMEGTTTS
ncbi:hypothetical protein [Streptomyces sp. NPDC001315]|uniref:hypothetical protein n=1 Tax=Streptomyces sp. NPDC001315 TaxID=3364562 RepID=UPI0036C201CD